MPYYEDPPEDFVCPLCNDETCEGCPGWESWDEEPPSLWDTIPDNDNLSWEDIFMIEQDILAERDEEEYHGY